MAHSEARAWWADVQHLRDGYERTDEARRRADEADLAARRATRERRGVEAEVSSMLSAPRRTSGGPAITPRRAPEPALAPRRGQRRGRDLAPQTAQHPEADFAPRAEQHPEAGFAPRAEQHPEADFAPRAEQHPAAGFAPRAEQHPEADFAPRAAQDLAVNLAPDGPPPRRARIKGAATPGRRTIEIRGQVVPAPEVTRSFEIDRRRPSRRAFERVGGRPDRVAMWALLMGLLLILAAIGTADSPAVVALTLY
jgi:hypothetical protein